MKTVYFNYKTELVFSSPASDHRFLLRILPQNDSRQRIKKLSWNIEPSSSVWTGIDGFGNKTLSGCIYEPHGNFNFGIEGIAEVSNEPYTESLESDSKPERILFYPSELTRLRGALADFYDRLASCAPEDLPQRVWYFSHAVHEHLRYERGVTANTTTAQEAFNMGAGVCQDYAHILLALLRKNGICCRYVAGLASDYGETHAWVEAWINDKYCGIDPTRDKFVDEGYIAISRGRDFEDSSVERGIFKGACRGTMTINLKMDFSG